MEKIEIEEIKKYVDELIVALKQAGQTSTVASLERIVERFKQPSEVRSAVYALDGMVRQWLRNAQSLPQDPTTQLTAQFLADACKNALAQGAINSLRPTPRESARKMGRAAMFAFGVGAVLLIVPLLLLVLGVNWVQWVLPEQVTGQKIERGTEIRTLAYLVAPAPAYKDPIGVRVELAGGCAGAAWDELSCEPSERLWSDGVRHVTYHVVRHAEVHGLQVAVRDATIRNGVGAATILVYADDATASGEYVIPLQGEYFAAPVPCAPALDDAGLADAGAATTSADGGSAELPRCDAEPQEPSVLKHSQMRPLLVHVP